jgi:hypothetical protein
VSKEPKPVHPWGIRLSQAEGEGFEPSTSLTTRNGFRDRRIRPLCHPSEVKQGTAGVSRFPDASLGVRRPMGQCSRRTARRLERGQRREAAPEPGSAGREGTPVREARAEKEGFEPSKEEISPLTP